MAQFPASGRAVSGSVFPRNCGVAHRICSQIRASGAVVRWSIRRRQLLRPCHRRISAGSCGFGVARRVAARHVAVFAAGVALILARRRGVHTPAQRARVLVCVCGVSANRQLYGVRAAGDARIRRHRIAVAVRQRWLSRVVVVTRSRVRHCFGAAGRGAAGVFGRLLCGERRHDDHPCS